jgi:hypothetical protein
MENNERVPGEPVLRHAVKLSLTNEKPIMLDYWRKSTLKGASTVVIGVRGTGEKLLVKNEEEYTSPIAKIYKVDTEYIVETENSLYVVCASIQSKRIS